MLHQPRGAGEDAGLKGDEVGEPVLSRLTPAGIGIAPPGSGAAAGGVDQHPIEAELVAFDPAVGLARKNPNLGIVHARIAQPLGAAFHAGLVHIAGDDPAPVVHLRGDSQRLAARTRAEIDHPLARLRIEKCGDKLGAFVLNFDLASLEPRQAGQR